MTDDECECGCGEGERPESGPPDPNLAPGRSPGFGPDPADPAEVTVDRDDVTIGEATPAELTATDVAPVADAATEDLVASLGADDHVVRQRAALALGDRLDDREAVVAGLAAAVEGDAHADVRQFAIESLAKLGGERAAGAAEAALSDPDPWVRAEAVVALDRLDRERHADAIEAALDDDHHAPRRNALVSLFKREGEAALGSLLDASRDDSERVREWGVHLLGGVDDDRARERLCEVAAGDDSDLVRRTAEWALDADPEAFRRGFVESTEDRDLAGADRLNHSPSL